MPELPEVETVCRFLRVGKPGQPAIIGHQIQGAMLLWDRTIAEPKPDLFSQRIIGQTIESIDRRGKFIKIMLSNGVLLVHLRMSGDLFTVNSSYEVRPHDRLKLALDDDVNLIFEDTRKFGRVWLVDDPERILGDLGPEPLSEDFTPEWLYTGLQARQRQLKPLLLDQHFIAGLGNIYTDEALFLAGLHPLSISNSLTYQHAESLWSAIQQTLTAAIQRNGTSIDWIYRGGDYQRFLMVYQRTGKPCKVCSKPIERIVLGQRSTHICSNCQKMY